MALPNWEGSCDFGGKEKRRKKGGTPPNQKKPPLSMSLDSKATEHEGDNNKIPQVPC